MSPPPVKIEGDGLGLRVVQPSSAGEVKESLESAGKLDVAVVVAYGRILKPDALAVPTAGMLNLHFSLLPRWRGAAPVSRALMAGDPMTGVTIFRLDEGLDTGPVLTAQAVDIDDEETAGDLTSRLATLGARLMYRRDTSLSRWRPGASATERRRADLRLQDRAPGEGHQRGRESGRGGEPGTGSVTGARRQSDHRRRNASGAAGAPARGRSRAVGAGWISTACRWPVSAMGECNW